MEGVPRMPMLQIQLKQNSIDFSSLDWAGMPSSDDYYESIQQQTADALKKHIRDEYGDNPDKFEGAIKNLLEAQLAAYKAMPYPDFEGCTIIKKYFGQLHYMQSRFPFKGDNGLKVLFAWQDAFTGFLTENDSLEFEQTAVLFNIGAIHSCLGAADSRISEEGIRISCVHFQCAAGIFTFLSENYDTMLSPDISQFMLKLFINLCLAQGQECLLEKSMQDNRKSSIVSKICQQVVDYYKKCLQSLENKDSNTALGSSTHKAWKKMVYFKVQYYSAITKYFMGNSSLDLDQYGQSVSYYGAAVAHLSELVKLVKGFSKETKVKVENALKFTTDVLNGKYNSAVKDNNYVYHDKVPDPAILPEAKGASLVKALPFQPANEDITGPDFFAKLVPIEAHLAASTYSEEKAKLLRTVVTKIDEKNSVIDQYKSSIELDPKKLIDPNHVMKLDVKLIEKCALLNTDQTPISNLKEHMEVLNDVYSELDSVLNDILSIVEKEESDDLRLKDAAGKEAFSVQEDIEGIRRELSVYTELHQKAGQMNEDLQTACRIHIQNMKVVATGLAGVEEDLKLKEASQLIGDEDKNDIELIRKLCNKVIEMEQQRKSLLEQLRQQMETDDVTSALVTKHGIDQDDLFKEELKKYDTLINTIDQNLSAQENIFDAVTEANARYTKIRKVVETERERIQQRSQNLVLSCTIAPEVSSRCNDGKKFFGEILSKAKGLYDRVKEFQEENDEKRSEIYKKIEEKKKPPPRPSAPKPKLKAPSEKKLDSASTKVQKPGMILSPEVLAKMMAEDDDELLNDPEFLLFLQNQGDMQHLTGDPLSPSLQQPLSMMSRPGPMPSLGNNARTSVPSGSGSATFVPPGPARSLAASLSAGNQPYQPSRMPVNRPSLDRVASYETDNRHPGLLSHASTHLSHPGVVGQSNLSPITSHAMHGVSQSMPQVGVVPRQMQKPPTQTAPHGMGSTYQQVDASPVQNFQQQTSSTYQPQVGGAQIAPTQSGSHAVASTYQQINVPPHHNLHYPQSSVYQTPTGQMVLATQPGPSQSNILPQQPISSYQAPAGQAGLQIPTQPGPTQSNVLPRQDWTQQPISTYQAAGGQGQAGLQAPTQPGSPRSSILPQQNLTQQPISTYQVPAGQAGLQTSTQPGPQQSNILPQQDFAQRPISTYQASISQVQTPLPQSVTAQHQQIHGQSQQYVQPYSSPPPHHAASAYNQPQQNPPVPSSSTQLQPKIYGYNVPPQHHGHSMQQIGAMPGPHHLQSERYYAGNAPPLASQSVTSNAQLAITQQTGYSAQPMPHQQTVSDLSIRASANQTAAQHSSLQGQFVHPSVQEFRPPQPNYPPNTQVRPLTSMGSHQIAANQPSSSGWMPTPQPNQRPVYVGQPSSQLQPQQSLSCPQRLPVSSQQSYDNRNVSAHPQVRPPSTMVQTSTHYQQQQANSSGGNVGPRPPIPQHQQANLNQSTQFSQSQNFSLAMQVSQPLSFRPPLPMSQQVNTSSQASTYSMAPTGIAVPQNTPRLYGVSGQNLQGGAPHHSVPVNQNQVSNVQHQTVGQVAPMKSDMTRHPMPKYQESIERSVNNINLPQPQQYGSIPSGHRGNQQQNHPAVPQSVHPSMTHPAGFSTQSSVESQISTESTRDQQSANMSHPQVVNYPASTPASRMHVPPGPPGNVYRPAVSQQYGQTRPSQSQQLIRPPVPGSYNPSLPSQPGHPQLQPTVGDGGNGSYQPRPKSSHSQPNTGATYVGISPGLRGHQQSPQQSTTNINAPRFQPSPRNLVRNAPNTRVGHPLEFQAQRQNLPPSPNISRHIAPMQPDQGGYTFRSHPHVGNVTSTPSNENSPKHVIKQPVSGHSAHQNLGILKPTPVGTGKDTTESQTAGQSSMDLAGLVLTPRRALSSSADELLGDSPEQPTILAKKSSQVMLIPTKVDEVDDKMVVRPIEGLPYMDEADLMHFKIQVTELRSKVSNLLNKPDAVGLCELDREWKQLSESQERHSRKLSTAIARCSSYKNRYQDIVPFDQSRVVLKATKDDYINASVIDGVSPYCPRFIAAQSPLPNTISDFWLMVYEQQVNIIVMLVNRKDVPKKCPIYWPSDRNVPQQHGPLTVSFTTSKSHGDLYIERTFTIKHKNQSLAMSVTQLQYIAWPEHRLPSSGSDLLSFLRVVQSYHSSQRNLQWPILVHCESGVGRTGVFAAFVAAVNEINAGMGIANIVDIVTKMRMKRKYMVQEKVQLKFVYDIVLDHAIDVLKQRNVVLLDETKSLPLPAQTSIHQDMSHPKSASFDIFSNQSALSSIQATVEKMTIKAAHDRELSASEASFQPPAEPTPFDNSNSDAPFAIQAAPTGIAPSHQYNIQGVDIAMDMSLVTSPPRFVDMSDLVQGTVSPSSNPAQAETTESLQANTSKQPDVVESCNSSPAGNNTSLEAISTEAMPQYTAAPTPSNLMDAMTPESFTLNLEEGEKKQRVSKADFYKPTTGLNVDNDASDPFSGLDPLWGLRK